MSPLLLALVLLAAAPPSPTGAPPAGKPSCCVEARGGPAALSDTSLYQLDSVWTDDAAKEMKLGALRGKFQVVTLFFAHCEFACPALVQDMKKLEKALPEELRGKVNFTLVSFDSERDTPAALHAYRQKMRIEGEGWRLLRGKPDDVLELSALLGVKFKKDARGQFAHSNLITILNPEGEIIHQVVGLAQNVTPAVKAIEKAVK